MAISKIITDDELIVKVQQGSPEAVEELFIRYGHYSWRLAHRFNDTYQNSGIELNEFYMVAFSVIPAAIKFYDTTYGAFYRYWTTFAWNELLAYFKENSYMSNPKPLAGKDDSYGFLSEELFGEEDETLSDKLARDEVNIIIEMILEKNKSKKEVDVINLFLKETSFEEIHKITRIPMRKVYYIIAKFKKAFANFYDE